MTTEKPGQKPVEYQKYEFCEDIFCLNLASSGCIIQKDKNCCYTAKQFHHWLKENGFKIIKEAQK